MINDIYKIGLDEFQRIRISIDGNADEEVKSILSKLVKNVMEIDNLLIETEDRIKYKRDIANIYQIGITEGEEAAVKYAENLKDIIENNLIINRKFDLFAPTILGFIIVIILFCIAGDMSLAYKIKDPVIYGSIGGILSVIIQNNKFDIDYKVDKKLLRFEAVKLVLISNIMALIGDLAIDSQLIFSDMVKDGSLKLLIYVLCGYSQTFIPNILKNFELKNE